MEKAKEGVRIGKENMRMAKDGASVIIKEECVIRAKQGVTITKKSVVALRKEHSADVEMTKKGVIIAW